MSYQVMKFLLLCLLQTDFASCIYILACLSPTLSCFCLASRSLQPLPCHRPLHYFSFWSALTWLACPFLCSLGCLRWTPAIFVWFSRWFPVSFSLLWMPCCQHLSLVSGGTTTHFPSWPPSPGSGTASPSSVLTTQPTDTFKSTYLKLNLLSSSQTSSSSSFPCFP